MRKIVTIHASIGGFNVDRRLYDIFSDGELYV